MTELLIALLLAAAVPGQNPGAPPALPRGPHQPAAGAASPELMAGPRHCIPRDRFMAPFIFHACFFTTDYPLAAFEAHEQGIVDVRVEIGADGRATACAVTQSSGSAALDSATCALLQRRIVGGAPERTGAPAATTLTGRVAWVLPPFSPLETRISYGSYFVVDDYPAPALRANEQGVVRFTNHVNAAGRVTGCEITGSSGSATLDAATCRIMQSRARYYPARDAEGRPVPGDDLEGYLVWALPGE